MVSEWKQAEEGTLTQESPIKGVGLPGDRLHPNHPKRIQVRDITYPAYRRGGNVGSVFGSGQQAHQNKDDALVERLGLVILRLTPDGTLMYASPDLARMLALDAEELKNDKELIYRLVHPEDRSSYNRLTRVRNAKQAIIVEVEYRVRQTDGTYHWVFERQTPKLDLQQQVEYYESVISNIQERKQLEAQLRLAQRMEILGSFAEGIAHDFNNRLAAIIGQIGLAIRELPTSHATYGKLAAAEQAALRCAETTKNLLSFGKQSDLRSEAISLPDLLDETVQLLQHILPTTIEVSLSMTTGLRTVCGNSTQLQQVLFNIAVNSRDAMPQGGSFRIAGKNVTVTDTKLAAYHPRALPGEYVEITVTDSGSGIPAAHLPFVFDPFFTTKGQEEGSGLGLSTAYGIIQAHRGHLEITNIEPHGTLASILLPAYNEGSSSCKKNEQQLIIRGGNETILVADDDDMVLSMVESLLRMHGYKVISAHDGDEAVKEYQENQDAISLCLIDQTMPKLTGRQVLDRLYQLNPDAPVILTSGFGENIAKLLPKNVNSRFLSKPYPVDALLMTVRELLDGD